MKQHEQLEWLSNKTNRSMQQTQFLFQLVGRDFSKLKALEVQIKNCFVSACPSTLDEVNSIMQLTPKSNYFNL